jgi:hypothetical protein
MPVPPPTVHTDGIYPQGTAVAPSVAVGSDFVVGRPGAGPIVGDHAEYIVENDIAGTNVPPGEPKVSPTSSSSMFAPIENVVLHDNLDKRAFYAAFRKATNSVLVAAKRCAFSSR